MTQTFGVNSNNDVYIGPDGNLVVRSGEQAVLTACANAAKAQLGEMQFATENGIPNFQTVWVGAPNLAIFEAYLRRALEGVDGVIEVTELTTAVSDGNLSYKATIRTVYGRAEING